MMILVVEDDPMVARWEREAIRLSDRISADTNQASSLAEALAYLRSRPVDAVILDPGLPDSHGQESVDAIAKEWPTMPLVVVTGALLDFQDSPADETVKKPVKAPALIEALLNAISVRVTTKAVGPIKEGEARIIETLTKLEPKAP